MSTRLRGLIAVDLDGTLAAYGGWVNMAHIGDPLPGAQEFVATLLDRGYEVTIYTCRCTARDCPGAEFAAGTTVVQAAILVREWLLRHNFPPEVTVWTGGGKPNAVFFVDDRAVPCDPAKEPDAYRLALRCISPVLREAQT